MEVPVYLITGFLESGKTSFINHVFSENNFGEDQKSLVIMCEEGMEEIDEEVMKKDHIDIHMVEEESELSNDFFERCKAAYHPTQVIIEFNGVWSLEDFLDLDLPKDWVLVQIITTVDASNFQVYLNNMRSIMTEFMSVTGMILFNRCTPDMDIRFLRRNVRVVNRRCELIFEAEDGSILDPGAEELPYDLNQDIIEITDDDYGIWYMDALNEPEKYNGKTVQIKGMVFKSKNFEPGVFVPGRQAMTCCADDITFLGFICHSKFADKLKNKQWITLTAQIRVENRHEYQGVGPVLYAKRITSAKKPEEELVYFS